MPLDDKKYKKVRNSKVWEFMERLVVDSTHPAKAVEIDDQLYCKLYFDEQKLLKEKGHVSKIYVAKTSTASGNHLQHVRVKHGKTFTAEPSPKLSSWSTKCSNGES